MATTWIKALHKGGGGIAAVLAERIEYAKDFEKTNGGELIYSYECQPFTAQSEFLLSKKLYEQKTGRDKQGKHDVIAYHMRMSFKPGEVTDEQALELGRELAMRWTKGKHQFIVAAHANTDSPHAHIVYNSVNLDCTGKYQDFKRSAIALRRVSDMICLEHGLSIVEKPGLSKGWNRNEYLGIEKTPAARERLREVMDASLSGCKSLDEFLSAMEAAGVEIKRKQQLAFKLPGGKRFLRQDSLGDDYSIEAILERISGRRVVAPKQNFISETKPNLLVDIQAKLSEGKGGGYEQWAKIFNLKESAKTLIFLKEVGIDSYDELVEKSSAMSTDFNECRTKIKAAEKRMAEISELQKHIGNYGKTRDVYAQYRKSGWSEKFFEEHRADLTLHKAAKNYFDSLGYGKNNPLPSMQSLRQEYAVTLAEKKKLYSGYNEIKKQSRELLIAKSNADKILGIKLEAQSNDRSQIPKRNNIYER